jgi:hypothetical protein
VSSSKASGYRLRAYESLSLLELIIVAGKEKARSARSVRYWYVSLAPQRSDAACGDDQLK